MTIFRPDVAIRLVRLPTVPLPALLALNNHPQVLAHMPFAREPFDMASCARWVADKDAQWSRHGYGPWGIFVDGVFAGWGGLQHEAGDADLALVLHPDFWGCGHAIYRRMRNWAFPEKGLDTLTLHLPVSRRKLAGLARLGFLPEGSVSFDGVTFSRYRLYRDQIVLSAAVRLLPCRHAAHWEQVRRMRQQFFFDPARIDDPYHWSFTHANHRHFVLLSGVETVAYAHVQYWPDVRAALRIMVVEPAQRGQGLGRLMLQGLERYLRGESRVSLHLESSVAAVGFYLKQGYRAHPFGDPAGATSPDDVALAKSLSVAAPM